MSMMERAQQMQQRGEQEGRQKAIFDAAMPVIQAKNAADIATANATISHFQQAQGLRTRAAVASDTANQEFLDAQQLSDWTTKSDAMGALQAKYAWMGQLPEYKPFVDAVNNARIEAHQSAMADMKLTGDLEIAKTNAQARIEATTIREQGLLDATTIKAGAATQNAETKATAPTAELKNIAAYAKAVASGDDTSASMIEDYLQSKHGMAPTKVADSLTRMAANEEKLANIAKQNGDDAAYQLRTSNVDKLRTRAEGILAEQSKPAATPSVSMPSTVAPTKVAPDAHEIAIGGKIYPIFKDAKGNRAYKIDGHYVPIQTE
jgi:hypothetical protein